MRIRLRGRDFLPDENKKESRVAVVNETFAKRLLNGTEPIGKRFNFSGPDEPLWEIVGVAQDGKYNTLGEEPKAVVFRPLRYFDSAVTLITRVDGDPHTAIKAIRDQLQQLDPTLPLYDVKTLAEHMNLPLFPAKVAAGALGSLAILTLVLTAVGIYGVMSYTVASRTREIGLRMALGAQSQSVAWLILRQGMTLAAIGSAIGFVFALGGTGLLKSVLYGVSAVDPVTFTVVGLILTAVVVVACWFPASRAAGVDPMVALRAQ
jgi:predicted permease